MHAKVAIAKLSGDGGRGPGDRPRVQVFGGRGYIRANPVERLTASCGSTGSGGDQRDPAAGDRQRAGKARPARPARLHGGAGRPRRPEPVGERPSRGRRARARPPGAVPRTRGTRGCPHGPPAPAAVILVRHGRRHPALRGDPHGLARGSTPPCSPSPPSTGSSRSCRARASSITAGVFAASGEPILPLVIVVGGRRRVRRATTSPTCSAAPRAAGSLRARRQGPQAQGRRTGRGRTAGRPRRARSSSSAATSPAPAPRSRMTAGAVRYPLRSLLVLRRRSPRCRGARTPRSSATSAAPRSRTTRSRASPSGSASRWRSPPPSRARATSAHGRRPASSTV